MRVFTARDVGALVASRRKTLGWTQTDLADRIGASRRWVGRFEAGTPGVEARLVFESLAAVGATLDVNFAEPDPGDPWAQLPSPETRTHSSGDDNPR